jgi:hypothetical protein
MCLTDLREGGTLWRTRGHSSLLGGLAFSPDGARLATIAHDGYLKLWPAEVPGAAVARFPSQAADGPALLVERIRDWKPLVLEGRDQTAVRVKQMQPHGESIWFAVYSPDQAMERRNLRADRHAQRT